MMSKPYQMLRHAYERCKNTDVYVFKAQREKKQTRFWQDKAIATTTAAAIITTKTDSSEISEPRTFSILSSTHTIIHSLHVKT